MHAPGNSTKTENATQICIHVECKSSFCVLFLIISAGDFWFISLISDPDLEEQLFLF